MTLIYYAYYYVNAVLKHLVNWLNAHKISINIKKTEMVTFTSKKNKFEGDLKTVVKDYTIQQKLSIISEWKLLEILGGNDNLMIFLLHGIEPMLFFLK